jgi:hypothetical protein
MVGVAGFEPVTATRDVVPGACSIEHDLHIREQHKGLAVSS